MPMALGNDLATFQSLMYSMFYDCMDEFMVVYVNTILILSTLHEDYVYPVWTVLERMKEWELLGNEIELPGLQTEQMGVRIADERKKIFVTCESQAT